MLLIKYSCLLSSVINEGQSVLVSLNYWFDKTINWSSLVVFDPVVWQEKTSGVIHQSGEFWEIDWRTQARIMQDLLLFQIQIGSKKCISIKTEVTGWLVRGEGEGEVCVPKCLEISQDPPVVARSARFVCFVVSEAVLGWIWPETTGHVLSN